MKAYSAVFGKCLNYKSGLRILIWPLEVPFSLVRKWALLAKSDPKKWHFEWPNQNSKTTLMIQTFPKYGPYGFDLVNLSLLSPILAKFQFCWFSSLFWAFSLVKSAKNKIAFLQRKEFSNQKIEEYKSGLEFNFPSKSKCPNLNFEIWVLGANLTEP